MTELDSSIIIAEAITKYGYGVTAMAVIIVVFLSIFLFFTYQNKVFTNDLIERNHKLYTDNQDNNKELKVSIDKLSKSVYTLSENYSTILDSIIKQLVELEKKYEVVTVQLIESVLDEKAISKRAYILINKYIITLYLNKTMVAILEHFDRNGLYNDEKLMVFRENVLRDLYKYQNLAYDEMSQLEFDSSKKELFLSRLSNIYEIYTNEIRTTILLNFKGNSENDIHYYTTKQQLKNKLNEMCDNIFIVLKEVLK